MKKTYLTNQYILNPKEFCQKPKRKYYPLTHNPLLCKDPLRQDINQRYCNYYKTTGDSYIWKPFEYPQNVETEYYLRHGDNTQCCLHWKNRHQ